MDTCDDDAADRSDPSQAEARRVDLMRLRVSLFTLLPLSSLSSLSPCTRLRQLFACAGARQNNNKADTHTQHKKQQQQRDTKTGHCLNGSAERKSNSLQLSLPSSLSLSASDNSRLPASLVCRCERRHRTLPAYERGRQRAAIKI